MVTGWTGSVRKGEVSRTGYKNWINHCAIDGDREHWDVPRMRIWKTQRQSRFLISSAWHMCWGGWFWQPISGPERSVCSVQTCVSAFISSNILLAGLVLEYGPLFSSISCVAVSFYLQLHTLESLTEIEWKVNQAWPGCCDKYPVSHILLNSFESFFSLIEVFNVIC